jgi:phosphopantetheine--protein transferase-like protein
MIGIDIEHSDNLPDYYAGDEMKFFEDYFSPEEIVYALNKYNPQKYFTSLFSLKEAIVKADNNYKNVKFNQIIILFGNLGIPYKDGFLLSVSYSGKLCVSTAFKVDDFSI